MGTGFFPRMGTGMSKRVQDFVVTPKMAVIRRLEPGDITVFRMEKGKQANLSSLFAKVGGKFEMLTTFVLDRELEEVCACTLVKCIEKANPKKPAGRPRKK